MSKNNKRSSKTRSIVVLCVMLVLTIACGWIGLNGLTWSGGLYRLLPWLPTTDADNWPEALALGLDLRGGVYVEYTATQPEDIEGDFNSLLQSTENVLRNRLTDKGYPEATVQTINGGTGIRVEVPDVTSPEDLLNLLGSPAELSFRGPDGVEFMTGKEVQTAMPMYDENQQPIIAFTLNSNGSKLFAEKTADSIGQQISIYLDGELLLAPTVQSVIADGKGTITGMGTIERATTIAAQIQSGSLPLQLRQDKVDTVSATLGDTALSTSVRAALIGILLIMLLLIIRYRVNGIVASWALCIYIILLFLFIAIIPGIQLTLPGLAGIVLGIGMAVDANVIIYERFNEELRVGRPAKAALRAGFSNALSAIIDANVTTVIAGIVLLFFGTGSIQGFAKTLLLGVIISMVSAVVITRLLMKSFIGAGCTNPSLYCSKKSKKEVAQ